MAVREYEATAYVQGDDGTNGLATVAQGAFTFAAVCKILSTTNDGALFDLSNAGTSRALFGYLSGGGMRYLRGSFEEADGGPAWSTSDGWVLVAWTKADGTNNVRFHKCVLSSETWTHQNSSTTVEDDDNTCTFWSTRPNNDSDFAFRGRIAAAAMWNSVLNDAAIEALRDDFADWTGAIGKWSHGQLSTSTSITDDAGDADQTSLTGSSVVFGDDPPGFVGFTTEPDFPYKVADRGSAQNLTSQASTAVDLAAGASIDTTNNILIARIALDNSGTNGAATNVTVSDPRSNTWTVGAAANQDPGAAAAGISTRIAYCVPTTAYQNGDDITFNYGDNTTAKAIVIEEWANIDRSNPVAVAQTTANGASGTPSISRTPGAVDQLFYGALGIEGPSGDTYTQDSDTTDGTWSSLTSLSTTSGTAASNATVRGAYKVVTGTTAQTWNPTITSRDWAQVALVFNAAPNVLTGTVNQVSETDTAQAITRLKTRALGRVTEAETAQPTVTPKFIDIGQVSEADTAQATGRVRAATAGQAAEADTAQAVGRAKTEAVGQLVETETARPITAVKTAHVGQVVDTSTAQPVTPVRAAAAGQTVETDTAQAVGKAKTAAVGQVAETDTARPITAAKVAAVGQAVDTSTAQPVAWAPKHRLVGQTAETDTARPVGAVKVRQVGQTAETDTAQATGKAKTRAAGQAAETDTAGTLTPVHAAAVQPAAETDTASPVAGRKTAAVGRASEEDTAQPITPPGQMGGVVGQAAELDTAAAIAARKVLGIGLAADTSSAGTLTAVRTVQLGRATETGTAQPVGGSKARAVGRATQADTASALTAVKAVRLGQPAEADTARPVGRVPVLAGVVETDTALAITFAVSAAIPGVLTPGSTRPALTPGATRAGLTPGASRPLLTPGRSPSG